MEIDDDGMVKLMRGAIVQAQRDAKNGDPEAKIFLQYMTTGADMSNDWVEQQLAQVDTTGPRRTALEPAPSPFENLTPERLDAMGVSPGWAGMTNDQLAELERNQAHRARADRLGVDYRYLPMED